MILSKALIGDDAAFDFDMLISKVSLIYRIINFLENYSNIKKIQKTNKKPTKNRGEGRKKEKFFTSSKLQNS